MLFLSFWLVWVFRIGVGGEEKRELKEMERNARLSPATWNERGEAVACLGTRKGKNGPGPLDHTSHFPSPNHPLFFDSLSTSALLMDRRFRVAGAPDAVTPRMTHCCQMETIAPIPPGRPHFASVVVGLGLRRRQGPRQAKKLVLSTLHPPHWSPFPFPIDSSPSTASVHLDHGCAQTPLPHRHGRRPRHAPATPRGRKAKPVCGPSPPRLALWPSVSVSRRVAVVGLQAAAPAGGYRAACTSQPRLAIHTA